MKEFIIGDKVVLQNSAHIVIAGEDVSKKIGTFVKTFEDVGIVIVNFGGTPTKIPIFILKKYEPEETGDPDPTVILKRSEFRKIVYQLEDQLFGDVEND